MRGFDGGKQVKGRKRHLLVNMEGFVLKVTVHPANLMDRDGVKLLLTESIPTTFPRLRHVWLDAGCSRLQCVRLTFFPCIMLDCW